ncbi:fimbria/pilus outer membrane usher protein [Pseudomonas sp. 148P]|uniref:Fimbria/pilus outer membrane usher protein n=1 Tax=Pseudomonas ulcerans TaxID=3115852 RepID=A0ABU7HUB2_9PSED|nr:MULTISPECIES: fimbria/pilus outer membrane usher protein [unclassified Pseudomonas]MEE1923975.1 fimbria/pilus outer membrane usher protein [Pseudomonas sp. 147P]MEE1935152.1 fimbria/pilus outer membrane usher protein [Pseudomonas sp. 148P]
MTVFAVTPLLAGELPPPPSGQEAVSDAQLYLELVVNQMNSGSVVPVQQRSGHLYVAVSDLRAAGIEFPVPVPEQVALDSIDGLHSDYDSQAQRLLLQVPLNWLPNQRIGGRSLYPPSEARSSFGALFNYDLYLNDTDDAGTSLSAWNEFRVFDSWGTFSTTGQWRQQISGDSFDSSQRGFLRYDTTFRYTDEERLLTFEGGDVVSGSLPWSSSVRLGGVQLSRDFAVRPDLITYPLPAFAGEAAVPSSLDLFINGYKSTSADLQPGPYTLTNVPYINGAGEAVVVTTDALGRQVSTTLPFYVTSTLLQKGLMDFSVAAGKLRRNYGISDFSYGSTLATGSLRYGVSDNFTLESHAEAGESLALGGIGGNLLVGNLGVINAALSHSTFESRGGQQLSLGYQYNSQRIGFSYQRLERRGDYADATLLDSPYARLSQRSEQVTVSLNMERYGSLGAGYFDVRAADNSRTRLVNLSWSRSLWGNTSLYLSANREVGGNGQWATQAQLVIPFDLRGTISLSAERNQNGESLQRVNYSRAVPSQGGVGFNLGYAGGDQQAYRQADLTWRLQSVQLQAGTYGTSDAMTRWADASGSVVWMDNGLFAANRIDDAFVVVSTNGFADVPVRYENQPVGRTNGKGQLLVPWSSAYYRGKYEIDPLELPANIRAGSVEQRVAVRRGAGYLLNFPLDRVLAASVELVDANHQDLPLGSQVTHQQSGSLAVVGWDGLVYLENLAEQNTLLVQLAGGGSCQAQFSLDGAQDDVPLIGPLVCK